MGILRSLLVVFLLPSMARAQDIELIPRFKVGDEFQLSISHTRQNARQPTPLTGHTTINVRVIATGADGSELEWIPGETEFSDPQAVANPLVGAAANTLRGLTLRLAFDAGGEFTHLANEPVVLGKLQTAVDMMIAELLKSVPAEQRSSLNTVLRQVLSPALLRSSATTDVQTYFGLMGTRLAVGKPIEFTVDVPNPFGGEPLPAMSRITVESATPATAALTVSTSYDADAMRKLTLALAQQAGGAIPEDKLPLIELKDEGRFVFDRQRGLMSEVQIDRQMTAGGVIQRADAWTIRLLTAPARQSR